MGISNDSKKAIKVEIERLEGVRSVLLKRIRDLKEKHDRFSSRKDEIVAMIQKLKADVN